MDSLRLIDLQFGAAPQAIGVYLVDTDDGPALFDCGPSSTLDALEAASLGAVLTGPGTARTGLLGAVRQGARSATDGPSTVDSAGTTVGSTASILALAEQLTGRSGDYGLAASARRVVPVLAGD